MKKILLLMSYLSLAILFSIATTCCSDDNDDPKSPDTPIEKTKNIDGMVITIPGYK